MSEQHPNLKTREEIERKCVPGFVEVLCTEGIEGVCCALQGITGWHRDYDPHVWRSRADEQQKRMCWEVGEATVALEEGPESFYGSSID